jgi:hypothetical protein
MTALTAGYKPKDKASPRACHTYQKLVDSGILVYEGGVTALDPATGSWTKASATNPALVCYGVARTPDSFDNTTGTNTNEMEVESGCYLLNSSGLTEQNEGQIVFVTDDQTFQLTSGGTAPVMGWLVEVVSSTQGYVVIDPLLNAIFASIAGAGGAQSAVALSNADATVQLAGGDWYDLPASTLTADHTLTLGTTGAVAGSTMRVTRYDLTSYHYTIVDGGSGTPTLCVLPAGRISDVWAVYNGTNWEIADLGTLAAAPLLPGAPLGATPGTIQVGNGNWYTLPSATLTAAASVTLGTTGAKAGDEFTITRLDVTGWALTVINGGVGAGNVAVLAGGEPSFLRSRFDGTNWTMVYVGQLVDALADPVALTDAGSTAVSRVGRQTWVTVPVITANRSYALPTLASSQPGDEVIVTRNDATSAFTAAFTDSGSGTATLLTMPVSKVNSAVFRLNAAGTHWLLKTCGVQ